MRFSPEGEVPIAPQISVTFSQPMVPLTSHEALSKLPVPVTVSPAVEGEWQWVGTKTLLFKSTGARMPMATRYTVTVPKGTRSDVGSTLEAQHSFTFQTPAVKVVDSYPRGNGQSTDPILFFSFDQRVDPDAAMKHIRVHTIDKPGNIPVEVRRATDAEIAADASVRRRAENTEPGRFVAFKPTEPLPNDQQVKVEFAAGATSAEGPRLTEKAQGFAFRTYGPMVVKRHGGAWGKKIQPMQPWFIEFSNPLDQESFEIGHLSVTPEIPGFDVQSMWGSRVNVRGLTKGNTTYKLTVGTKVKDIYGQTLEAPKTLTFRVGPADPAMSVPASPFVVLDPHGKPRLDVFTVNQTGAYTRHIQDERRVAMPGDLVMEYDVTIKGEADELTATSLDLAGAFEKCGGNAVVWIRGNKARLRATRPHARVWVQRAQLAVSAYADQEEALVWVTNLADGTPIENAEVTLLPERITARTRADGTAMIKLPPSGAGRAAGRVRRVITAKAGEQAGFVPDSGSYWGGGYWARRTDKDSLAWYVVNDRGMYKPGESVSIKGWVRKLTAGKGSDVTAAAVQKVTYRVVGARGNEIVKGEVEVGPLMGFHFEAALPKNANLGWARVELSAIGADDANGIRTNHNFQIQEFRRPKFEVTAKGSQGPHLVGASAEVTVSAKYFAGGALPGAPVNWSVNASPASFTPPNRSDYTFGTWVPWWRSHYEGGGSHQRFEGTTDGKGDHRIRLDFTKVDPPRPTTVTATANVEDVDRQSWSAAATLLVHPSLHYV
ncbi:MAG: Ig-like domain-containing domain, partial [Planctomycetota bacterium]